MTQLPGLMNGGRSGVLIFSIRQILKREKQKRNSKQ